MRISYDELHGVLRGVLIKTGLAPDRADLCARLFADSSRDGVASHGLNRFPRFMRMIQAGTIDVQARPERVAAHGSIERWDGRRGPGNLNAHECMDGAMALSRTYGIGCVALSNTTHWMRGGTYGWQAAEAGAIGICWTNTLSNLPPWGASDPRLGNNPLVVAVPRPPAHVVLDMAMSQFSYGSLASYRVRGAQLPVAGGYDAEGRLTTDPAAIEASGRLLPAGFWKGSGLALVLDMMATLLSGGLATWQVPLDPEHETGICQVFLAFDLASVSGAAHAARVVQEIVGHFQEPSREGERARYPGQRTLETRRQNLAQGIPVEPSIWQLVKDMSPDLHFGGV